MKSFLFGAGQGLFPDWAELPFIMIVTTIIWMTVTFMTRPESKEVLQDFYRKIQPGGPGWTQVVRQAEAENADIVSTKEKWSVPSGIIAMLLGVALVYALMFATGYWIYGKTTSALILTAIAAVAGVLLLRAWGRMKANIL